MTSTSKPRVRRYVPSERGDFFYPWNLVRISGSLPSPMLAAKMTTANRRAVDMTGGRSVLYVYRPSGDTEWPKRLYKWSVYDDP